MKKAVTIRDLANHFGLIWVNGDRDAMRRGITEIAINRPGLELAGFFDYTRSKRIILIGTKECNYIKTMTYDQIKLAMDFLMVDECPGAVICAENDVNEDIIKIAQEKNFPLFKSNSRTNDLTIDIVSYLSEELAPSTSIHGTLLEVFSTGVIIMGESGIGKSETALELIKKGHRLVSDDRVDISLVRNHLFGRSPELLHNMIEVRGLGIIDVAKMFGVNTIVEQMQIDMIIKLVGLDSHEEMDRLGSSQETRDILGCQVPVISIPVSGARVIGDIIEVAVTNFKLKRSGYDSTYEFEERLNELLRRE